MTEGSAKKNEAKICGVCGDKALGYNFNAVTCESCKAFFRRNALKKKEFKCPFNDSCKVDVVTRRFCQKCRLKKCFTIGMKKEWIMTEEEKKIKKQKIEENRHKRLFNGHSPRSSLDDLNETRSPTDEGSRESHISSTTSTGHGQAVVESCRTDIPVEVNVLTPMSEGYDITSPMSNRDVGSISSPVSVQEGSPCSPSSESLCSPCSTSGSSDVKPTIHHLPSPSPSMMTMSPSSQQGRSLSNIKMEMSEDDSSSLIERVVGSSLTSEQVAQLQELIVANQAMNSPIMGDSRVESLDSSLINVINLTDIAIRRLIKMSKRITGFKNICEGDQVALLKGGCTELMILRSVMTYNSEIDCWQGPKGPQLMQIKFDVLREAKGNVYEEHKRFLQSFERDWRVDENIMLILGAITLFDPNRPNLVGVDIVRKEQDSYFTLLRCYLRSIYSRCRADDSFRKLIRRLEHLHILNEDHVRVFLDVNPKDVEPLLIEIFDLKH
ncbi:receptor [Chamberlinius hualienensis]